MSKQEEAECSPGGLGAGGRGEAGQGPWLGRPGEQGEGKAEDEGAKNSESRGCLSSRVSFAGAGAWAGAPSRDTPLPLRTPLQ